MQIEVKKDQENAYTMTIEFEHKSWRSPSARDDFASERLLFPPQTELQHVISKLKESSILTSKSYQSAPNSLALNWQVKQNKLFITGDKQVMMNVLFVLYGDRYIDEDEFKFHQNVISPKPAEPQYCCSIL